MNKMLEETDQGPVEALHRRIDSEQMVERFVLGTLEESEQAFFEEHFLTCDRCLDQLQETERLQTALRGVAVEEGARWQQQAGLLAALLTFWQQRSVRSWATALVLIAVVGTGWWQLNQDRDRLRGQLELALTPPSRTFLVPLDAVRSSSETGGQELIIGTDNEWIVLAVPITNPESTYEAELLGQGETAVWQQLSLRADNSGQVLLGLPSSLFEADQYALQVWPQDQPQDVQRYDLSMQYIGN